MAKSIHNFVRSFTSKGGNPELPYQSFLYGGRFRAGQLDTVRLFYSLGLSHELQGLSWLDLGTNEGSIPVLAASHGATPVVGVEVVPELAEKARQRILDAGVQASVLSGDIIDMVPTLADYDVISLFALYRHLHKGLMIRGGHDVKSTGVPHLLFDSYRVLVQGEDNPVRDEYNALIAGIMARARRYFVSSFHDRSGLIARRPAQVEAHFRSLCSRVADVEVFSFDPKTPEYVVAMMSLRG